MLPHVSAEFTPILTSLSLDLLERIAQLESQLVQS